MRRIIAITQVSLDGIMQAPGGPEEDPSNGFAYGGWAMPFGSDAVNEALEKIMSGKFDLLLGRRTYDIFAGYWPREDNFIAKAFNKATKYVVTRGHGKIDWEKSVCLGGDVVKAVRKLKETKGPALHIWGSSVLLQALIAAGLIDEYQMWICPVLLGKGKRLFEAGVPAQTLKLVSTKKSSTGVMINTYRPAAPLSKSLAQPKTKAKAKRTK